MIALIASTVVGAGLPLFSLLFGGTINDLSATKGDFMDNIIKNSFRFLYVGAGCFLFGGLALWLWILISKRVVKKIKLEYFQCIMKQEQKWFDEIDTYQFATKIQTQCTTIESGVYFIKLAR
jgi:hypothetical protein